MTVPHVPGPVAVEVVRSGVVESIHTGHLVVLGPDGEVVLERGRPDLPVFWRSAAKPLQAAAVVAAQVRADRPAAGHGRGVARGRAGARRRRALDPAPTAAWTEDDLGCPPDLPLDEAAAGRRRTRAVRAAST